MKEFIGSALVLVVLFIIVFFIIRGMIKDKKSGKGTCGGDCSLCHGECSNPQNQQH